MILIKCFCVQFCQLKYIIFNKTVKILTLLVFISLSYNPKVKTASYRWGNLGLNDSGNDQYTFMVSTNGQ